MNKDTPSKVAPRDGWTRSVPTPVHWVLTVATLGLWAIIWRGRARFYVPAILSGCLLFLSFAGFDIWWFGFFVVVPLLLIAERAESTKQAWRWSWFAGWVGNFGGFYWIANLLMDFGHMPVFVALPACLALTLYQGLSFAAFGALTRVIRSRRKVPMVLLAPVLWTGIELLMPLLFPYYLGNSQYIFPPTMQIAELLGPLGVSAMLFIANGAIYDALDVTWLRKDMAPATRRRTWIGVGIGVALVLANLVYGLVRIAQVDAEQDAADKLRIAMVEANIGIWEKEAPDKIANNLVIHQTLSQQAVAHGDVDLLVWPESSFQSQFVWTSSDPSDDVEVLKQTATKQIRWIPRDATYIRPSEAPPVSNVAEDAQRDTPLIDQHAVQRGFHVPILFGGLTYERLTPEQIELHPPNKKMRYRLADGTVVSRPRPFRVFNSAILLDEVGRIKGLYDKVYLLAGGEYVPGADYWPWIYDLIPEASEFTPGDRVGVFDFKGHKLGLMICYEDVIPSFGRRVAQHNPDVLINITNDAWFGKTHEPYLHLALAVFRAVETRKWLLRSTNTGVTAFVDATGELVGETSLDDAEVLTHDVAMMTGEPTLYVRTGDVIGYLALAGIVALFVFTRRRRGDGRDTPNDNDGQSPSERDQPEVKGQDRRPQSKRRKRKLRGKK